MNNRSLGPIHSRRTMIGWLLFAGSGVCFLIVAAQEGSALGVVGAVLWLAGIGFFLMDAAEAD